MGSVKNISGEDLEVLCLRRTVADGETVEDVPGELLDPAKQLWAESHWLVNGQPQPPQPADATADPGPEVPDLSDGTPPPQDPTNTDVTE